MNAWRRLRGALSCWDGDRVRWQAGDCACPDDPRGRELAAALEFGVVTGEFEDVGWDGKTYPKPEYGSWGAWVHVWQWGASLAVRGPVLGHYPPDEDDEVVPHFAMGYGSHPIPSHHLSGSAIDLNWPAPPVPRSWCFRQWLRALRAIGLGDR